MRDDYPHRMLDVMIGVNGIGMGHSIRQSIVAQFLRDRGHRVRIVTNGPTRVEYFKRLGFPTCGAWMPALVARKDRIGFVDAVLANSRRLPTGVLRHRRIRQNLRNGIVPDVFITDYEPNVARLAYSFGRPLITVDQQSKYRLLNLPPVGGYTREADEQRLRWFVPHAHHSFICSFVPLRGEVPEHEIIPPILSDTVLEAKTVADPFVTAYFSRYFDHGPHDAVSRLAGVFRRHLPKRRLRIYVHQSELETLSDQAGGNTEIRSFDRTAFLDDLARSEAVFSNAGFNLIGEAIALGKPLYLVPLPTYDQHWCADAVTSAGLGAAASRIDVESVLTFMERGHEHRVNVEQHRDLHYIGDPRARIADYLESLT